VPHRRNRDQFAMKHPEPALRPWISARAAIGGIRVASGAVWRTRGVSSLCEDGCAGCSIAVGFNGSRLSGQGLGA
jgi:hypothetical protein